MPRPKVERIKFLISKENPTPIFRFKEKFYVSSVSIHFSLKKFNKVKTDKTFDSLFKNLKKKEKILLILSKSLKKVLKEENYVFISSTEFTSFIPLDLIKKKEEKLNEYIEKTIGLHINYKKVIEIPEELEVKFSKNYKRVEKFLISKENPTPIFRFKEKFYVSAVSVRFSLKKFNKVKIDKTFDSLFKNLKRRERILLILSKNLKKVLKEENYVFISLKKFTSFIPLDLIKQKEEKLNEYIEKTIGLHINYEKVIEIPEELEVNYLKNYKREEKFVFSKENPLPLFYIRGGLFISHSTVHLSLKKKFGIKRDIFYEKLVKNLEYNHENIIKTFKTSELRKKLEEKYYVHLSNFSETTFISISIFEDKNNKLRKYLKEKIGIFINREEIIELEFVNL